MIIVEQNIGQIEWENKKDVLVENNCYNKLLNENADIIILNEVTCYQNVIDSINELSNNKYNHVVNEKDSYYISNGHNGNQNKILIFYDKEQFIIKNKNENLNSIDAHLDFLHVTVCDKDNNDINIIGIRIYGMNDFDDAKTMFKSVCKVIDYASVYDNVILAGDFNNGTIMENGIYNSESPYIYYNYHKIFDKIMSTNVLKILTDGIDTTGYTIHNVDFKNKWTYYGKDGCTSMLDHFIVSSNFKKEQIEVIKDKSLETTNEGGLPHRIVKLTGKFIKTHFRKNTMLTNEFRFNLCLFIEFFQYLENDLKSIYAKLIDGYYPDCFDEVAEKPIGILIKKLKEVEKNEQKKYLSDEDYDNLNKVREMRNYWCHTCYNEQDYYIEQQSDRSFIIKERELLKRLKNEREIVRLLRIKMANVSNKIPEKVDKWKLKDFIKIIEPIYYIKLENN